MNLSFISNFFNKLFRINKEIKKIYVERFTKFRTKRLKSKTNPKLAKFKLIIVGIEVNNPVKVK